MVFDIFILTPHKNLFIVLKLYKSTPITKTNDKNNILNVAISILKLELKN